MAYRQSDRVYGKVTVSCPPATQSTGGKGKKKEKVSLTA